MSQEVKPLQICLSPKEILLWRQPGLSIFCYLVLYNSIGFLETHSVLTILALTFLFIVITEFVAREVCLPFFNRRIVYTNSLSSPMSPLSVTILEMWTLAGEYFWSHYDALCKEASPSGGLLLLAKVGLLGLATYVCSFFGTVSLLTALVTIIMVGPAAVYFTRYSHIAQAIAQFSTTICQPGLLDDDSAEENSDDEDGTNYKKYDKFEKSSEEKSYSTFDELHKEITKDDEFSKPPPTTEVTPRQSLLSSKPSVQESLTPKLKVSASAETGEIRGPSRKDSQSSTESLDLDDYTIITEQDLDTSSCD